MTASTFLQRSCPCWSNNATMLWKQSALVGARLLASWSALIAEDSWPLCPSAHPKSDSSDAASIARRGFVPAPLRRCWPWLILWSATSTARACWPDLISRAISRLAIRYWVRSGGADMGLPLGRSGRRRANSAAVSYRPMDWATVGNSPRSRGAIGPANRVRAALLWSCEVITGEHLVIGHVEQRGRLHHYYCRAACSPTRVPSCLSPTWSAAPILAESEFAPSLDRCRRARRRFAQ